MVELESDRKQSKISGPDHHIAFGDREAALRRSPLSSLLSPF
jgi:hypothetical protein